MRRERPAPPYCQSGPRWVRERLKDKQALAPLTGTDWRAFKAFFHLVDLYGNTGGDERRSVVLAMAYTLQVMQPSTRHLAKAGIPHVLDWSHEDEIWRVITTLEGER